MCLLSSAAFRYLSFLKEHVWFLFFKICVAKSDVHFFQFGGGDLCLVNGMGNVPHITTSVNAARILVAALADIFHFIRGF